VTFALPLTFALCPLPFRTPPKVYYLPMPKLLRFVLFGCLSAAVVASTGCIEFERVITLNKDLSGTAKFRMTMNMEVMARFAAQMEHGMSGKAGDVTEAEIQDAIKKMKDDMAGQPQPDPKTIAPTLPEGFTLVDISQKLDGLKMTVSATIGFKDIRKLAALKMSDPSSNGMSDNDLQPFEGIEVKDEGQTLLITAKLLTTGDSKMMAPKADAKAGLGAATVAPEGVTDAIKGMVDGMGAGDALKTQLEATMKEFREIFRVETPMTVVETNATKREASSAVWEYSMDSLMKMQTPGSGTKPPVVTMSIRVKK